MASCKRPYSCKELCRFKRLGHVIVGARVKTDDFINGELDDLAAALRASLGVLAEGGRLAVISFHSLEDRIVKQFMARHSREVVDRRAPFAAPQALPLRLLGRTRPGEREVAANPRARSAILRVAERTAAPWSGEAA